MHALKHSSSHFLSGRETPTELPESSGNPERRRRPYRTFVRHGSPLALIRRRSGLLKQDTNCGNSLSMGILSKAPEKPVAFRAALCVADSAGVSTDSHVAVGFTSSLQVTSIRPATMSPAATCRRRTGLPVIGFQVLLIALLGFMIWGTPKNAAAQDAPKGNEQRKDQSEGSGERYFARGQVDFWGTRNKAAERNQNQPAPVSTNRPETPPEAAEKWTESVTADNGQVTRHTPAPIVIDLLEDPSETNARRYLQWQREKLQKILKAQQVVERVQAQLVREQKDKSSDRAKAENPANGKDSLPQHSQEIQPTKSLPPAPSNPQPQESLADLDRCELVFFFQPGCPHCTTQATILNQVIAKHPKLQVAAVNTSERQELAMAFGVDATPTLILKTKSKPQMLRLEGVTTYEKLLRAARDLFEGTAK